MTLLSATMMSFASTNGGGSDSFCSNPIFMSTATGLSLEGTGGTNVTTCCRLDARDGKFALVFGEFCCGEDVLTTSMYLLFCLVYRASP